MIKKYLEQGLIGGVIGGSVVAAAVVGIVVINPNGLRDRIMSSAASGASTANSVSVTAMDVSDIVARVNPAVVSIVISKDVPKMEMSYINPFGFGVPTQKQTGTEHKEVGGGSGYFVSADGYVVTNNHVVSDEAADYTVFTTDGKQYAAKVIAKDSDLDVALLKIDATGLPFLEFGDSATLKLGQAVIAIGNALDQFRNTVSTGVVSGLARSITAGNNYGQSEQLDNVIQTDAAINPGNSGGPLIDLNGKVVGMNVATYSNGEGIGFALPASIVGPAIDSMKTNGRVITAYLGVRYLPIDAALKTKNNLSVDYGALVVRGQDPSELAVIPGSPADKAGIVENDIILEMDGMKIDSTHTLASIVRTKKVGDMISLKISDKGTDKTVSVILIEKPAAS